MGHNDSQNRFEVGVTRQGHPHNHYSVASAGAPG